GITSLRLESGFNFSAHNGQRGLEFVGSVAGKTGGLGEASLKAVKCIIQDMNQSSDFVIHRRLRQPLAKSAHVNLFCRAGYILQRLKCFARNPPDAESGYQNSYWQRRYVSACKINEQLGRFLANDNRRIGLALDFAKSLQLLLINNPAGCEAENNQFDREQKCCQKSEFASEWPMSHLI